MSIQLGQAPRSDLPEQLGIATAIELSERVTTGSNIGLTQAYEIREIASNQAKELGNTPAKGLEEKAMRAQALRNVSSVWDMASERIRIIRGRPLPGSLRPSKAAKPVRKPSTLPSETLEA